MNKQRFGHDDQRRARPLGPRLAVDEDGQKLDRLAQPHVVGQAPAEPQLLQELQPAESLLLITAQFAAKAGGLFDRFDAEPSFEPVAQLEEFRVVVGLGLGRQKGVEQGDGVGREADMVLRRGRQARQKRETLDPLLGKNAQRPVVQADRGVAACHGGQQVGETDRPPVEVDVGPQLEPVDVGSHAKLQIGRLADLFAVGVHLPTGRDQRPDRRSQRSGRNLDVASRPAGVQKATKSLVDERQPALLLALLVSQDAAAQRPLGNRPLRARGADHRSEIIEQHVPLQAVAVQQRPAAPAA